jgi:hypothetical protein
MSQDEKQRAVFTPEEMRVFKSFAVIAVAIAAGMYVVAPKGVGQLLGVIFAVALTPVPPLVIFLVRRWRLKKEPRSAA